MERPRRLLGDPQGMADGFPCCALGAGCGYLFTLEAVAFGSGASATVFGASGSSNFLTKTTTALAFVFLVNSLALAWMAKERSMEARELNIVVPEALEQPVEEAEVILDEVPAEVPDSDIPFIPE